jgi:hypothetical protein
MYVHVPTDIVSPPVKDLKVTTFFKTGKHHLNVSVPFYIAIRSFDWCFFYLVNHTLRVRDLRHINNHLVTKTFMEYALPNL